MKKIIRSAREIRHFTRHIRGNPVFEVLLSDRHSAEAVRRLQASVYLDHGNINEDQINEHGFLNYGTDPYFSHSVYFSASRKGEVLAGGRLILPLDGYNSLQISKELQDSLLTEEIATSARNGLCVELSGLVKKKGGSRILPLLIIKDMHRYAKESGYEYILMSVTEQPYKRFKKIFGGAILEIGQPYKIPHGNNIVHPCAIDVSEALLHVNSSLPRDGVINGLIKKLMNT